MKYSFRWGTGTQTTEGILSTIINSFPCIKHMVKEDKTNTEQMGYYKYFV
jgi:hypothetical protein